MTIHEVFPYLRVSSAKAAIEFYRQAFGATEKFRLTEPSGRIGHAELAFGTATVMLSDEYPECDLLAPQPGESILDIAERMLGNRNLWTEIYRINQTNPAVRPPAMIPLSLPSSLASNRPYFAGR